MDRRRRGLGGFIEGDGYEEGLFLVLFCKVCFGETEVLVSCEMRGELKSVIVLV